MNDYSLEIYARDRMAEAQATAARHAVARSARTRCATYSLGVALVRIGVWLVARSHPPLRTRATMAG